MGLNKYGQWRQAAPQGLHNSNNINNNSNNINTLVYNESVDVVAIVVF